VRRTRSGSEGSRAVCAADFRGESGQSLIIIVIAMSLVLAMAAFAIDVAEWHGKRHQAQVAADAAALAAANCLATRGCNSMAAHQTAIDYATANGVPASNVDISGGDVTVTTQAPTPESFAGMFGVHPTASARAVASYKQDVQAQSAVYGAGCATPTNPPTSGCVVDCSHPGVTIDSQGNTTISGAIETNSYVDINIKGDATLGPVQSGPGVGKTCGTNSTSVKGNSSIADGPADATGFTSFPTTYSAVWTSAGSNECTDSSTYTASGYVGHSQISVSGGTSAVPSTITIGGNNTTVGSATTPVVMCASTSITLSGQQATLNDVTLVAPSITLPGNGLTITPDPSATPDGGGSPAVAIYDTGSTTLDFPKNNLAIEGAVYAPMAEILIEGNNGSNALFEGNTVDIQGNNGGDGPTTTLSAFPGGDQLTQ